MIHTVFDLLAWAGGLLAGLLTRRFLSPTGPGRLELRARPWYFAAAALGGLAGAVILGSANTLLAGLAAGKSLLGGLLGAILAVEAYKRACGLRGSTGLAFVPSLATGIVIGRIGCLLSGLDDYTYGIPTGAAWGWDFGDGIPRHPVALYESLAMAAFLAWFLRGLAARHPLVLRHGFALFAGWYALQRFAWEFLKPYPTVLGPLNLFHLGCLALAAYAAAAILLRERSHA